MYLLNSVREIDVRDSCYNLLVNVKTDVVKGEGRKCRDEAGGSNI